MINFKSNKGITLVVLIVTIVIMIILASVVIKISINDKGIINKTQDATNTVKIENTIHSIEQSKINAGIQNNDLITLDIIAKQIVEDGITTSDKVTVNIDNIEVIDKNNKKFIVTKTDTIYVE